MSFAETVEMVEFDPAVHAAHAPMVEYDATLMMAHQAHAAPAPMAEYDVAPTMAYQVYAVPHQEHEALVTVVQYDAPAPIVAQQVHAAPALVDEYDASAAGQSSKTCMFLRCRSWRRQLRFRSCRFFEKIVDTPENQTVQSTEVLDTAPDLEMAPAEQTLRIPLADCEGAIEELSNAMAEGFSAVLDEVIENFDKPEGLSAVIDEHFEKFDKPDKKHESDEHVCGTWASEKGESSIFRDYHESPLFRGSCG